MKSLKNSKFKKTIVSGHKLALLVAISILFGCAKELPIKESDDIKDNVIPLSIFEQEIILKTGTNAQAAVSGQEHAGLLAVNEKGLVPVMEYQGPDQLKPLFSGLYLENNSTGSIKVKFRLTKKFLVAYQSSNGADAQNFSMQALHMARGNSQEFSVPLFQFPVASYGIKRKTKNATGDETRDIEFVETNQSNSTHVKISSLVKDRTLAGLFGQTQEEQRKLFLKSRIENKIWHVEELRALIHNGNLLSHAELDSYTFQDQDLIQTKIYDNELYLFRPVALEQLNAQEKLALKIGLKIRALGLCSEAMAKAAAIDLSKCYLRSSAKFSAVPVAIKNDVDSDGAQLATIKYDSSEDKRNLRFLFITADSFTDTSKELLDTVPALSRPLTVLNQDYDFDSLHLYVPSTHDTPREVVMADPFFQGSEKLVKLRKTEEGIKVYELEKDARFASNDLNNSPTLTIPGQYVEYTCDKDLEGICKGALQTNNQVAWDRRQFFIPFLENLGVQEVNSLNIFNVNDGCARNTVNRLTHHEISKGVLNIELERTFEIPPVFDCIVDLFYDDNLKSASFNVKYFYSIIKLDSLVSKDYEPIDYPVTEQDDFGFFKNEQKELNSTFDPSRPIQKFFLNRFNPKKGVIKYHLSKSFDKPENAHIKNATYKVIENINRALTKAQSGIQLELLPPSDIMAGDIRVNSIVLIDDPLSNGLLGYGPSVSNPLTGEILQAHTNMYGGVLTTMTRRVYNSMVDLSKQQAASTTTPVEGGVGPLARNEAASHTHEMNRAKIRNGLAMAASGEALISNLQNISAHKNEIKAFNQAKLKLKRDDFARTAKEDLAQQRANNQAANSTDLRRQLEGKSKNKYDRMLERYSENNAYHMEFFNFTAFSKGYIKGVKEIPGVLNDDGSLRPWDELDEEQQKKATILIVTHAYTSTLTHELGHNLGLRHNFIGSADKDNFYTEDESKELGLEHIPQYSSIMDYGYSELNELPIFGKYDVAALQFAYARKVELTNGEVRTLGSNLTALKNELKQTPVAADTEKVKIKNYEYCTDENAGLSVTCNRFDEGSTITDIATHYIQDYEASYKSANHRDGRLEYSTYGMGNYARYRSSQFTKMRKIFEEFESYAELLRPMINGDSWAFVEDGCNAQTMASYPDLCRDINDRRDAAKLIGEFFLKVLKTPDHVCALAKKDAPTEVVEIRPFLEIYRRVRFDTPKPILESCFEPEVAEYLAQSDLVVAGEAGKSLISYKGTDPRFKYKSDIDVRGVWPDKLLAMRSLTTRFSGNGSTEDYQASFLEHQGISEGIYAFLEHIITGIPLQDPVSFKTSTGKELQVAYNLGLGSYIIPEQVSGTVIRGFNLPTNDSVLLNEKLIKIAEAFNFTTDPAYRTRSRDFTNAIGVYKRGEDVGISNQRLSRYTLDGITYGASNDQILGKMMIDSINNLDFLESIEASLLTKVIEARNNPVAPDTLTQAQKDAFTLPDGLPKALIPLAQRGVELKEENLVGRFGAEQAKQIVSAYTLGAEGLQAIIDLKETLRKTPPTDASDIERRLYTIDLATLEKHQNGKLAPAIIKYKDSLPLLILI